MAGTRLRIRWGRLVVLSVIGMLVILFGTGAGFVLGILRDLPPIDAVNSLKPVQSSIIYDRNGQIVRTLHDGQNRELVDLKEVPKNLIDAFIATEDRDFYTHHGINPKAIVRALWVIATRQGFQGGSTITQQLAKNAFLTPEQTIKRKVAEAWYAIQLERTYTKDEILGFYLNMIYFGDGAYGVQAASKHYFSKPVKEITLAEAAMLAGITKSPADYNPFTNYENAKLRQHQVLENMVAAGYLTPEQAQAAKQQKIELNKGATGSTNNPDYPGAYFVDYVIEQLLPKYGKEQVYRGGLKIYTTLDPQAQRAAEEAVKLLDGHFKYNDDKPKENVEAAAVFMDAKTGYVRALVGGRKHKAQLGTNRATLPHQPGSTIKPLSVYAPGLEAGLTPGTVFDDAPMYRNGKIYPHNWDFTYQGLITVRDALKLSVNVVAIKIAERIGLDRAFESVKRFGITTLVDSGPQSDKGSPSALALGGLTQGITPLEMAGAYSTFANNGVRTKPVTILKVIDSSGRELDNNEKSTSIRVLSPQVNYLMVDMMKSVIREGTGGRANINRPSAGKTGSTDDFLDVWFAGYTPHTVGVVWVGWDDKKNKAPLTSGGGFWPHRIWQKAMTEITKNQPADDWVQPGGLVRVDIDTKSGKLPGDFTPKETVRSELFIAGTEPKTKDDVHVPAIVCANDPKVLYDIGCAGCIPTVKVFIKRPEPWQPTPTGRGPNDADQELPTKTCRGLPASSIPAPGTGTPGQTPVPAPDTGTGGSTSNNSGTNTGNSNNGSTTRQPRRDPFFPWFPFP